MTDGDKPDEGVIAKVEGRSSFGAITAQGARPTSPTEEYRKVASMDVDADPDRIAIRLASKPGQSLDSSEIDACLDQIIGKVGDSAELSE